MLGVGVGVVAVVVAEDLDGPVVGAGQERVGQDVVGVAGGEGVAGGVEEEDVVGAGEEFLEVVGDDDDRGRGMRDGRRGAEV